MIYHEVTRSMFHDAFLLMGRGTQFSFEARGVLWYYLNEFYEDYELDVISLCCEFIEMSEYEFMAEIKEWQDNNLIAAL